MYQQWAICLIACHEWRLKGKSIVGNMSQSTRMFHQGVSFVSSIKGFLGNSNEINTCIGNSHLIVIYLLRR